ncbi:hypothetical protein Tco_0899600, partial [Tanacetum coccineum]
PRPARDVDPDVIDSIIFGPPPRPHGYVNPDFVEPIIFGPHPRPDNYLEPEDLDNLLSMEDDTTHGGFHVESHVRPYDAPTPTADAVGRAEDPVLLTSLSEKLDRCMGRIDSLETELGTTKKTMGGVILTLVSRVKKLEKTVKQLRTTRLVGDIPASEGDVDIQDDIDLDGLSRMASTALGHDQPAVPSEDVEEREEEEVPLRRKRSAYRRARTEFSTPAFEQFQANLSAGVLPHTAVPEPAGPSVAADKGKRAKELDDLMMRMTETDWLNLMMQVGSNPALARELLGADVNEENFIERMNAVKEKKKRALADLRYRALKGQPMKKSEDRLLSAQYNLFRPKPAITEPPSKRQRVERVSSQPASVPAATTLPADDPNSAGGGSSNPAGLTTSCWSAASNTAGGAFDSAAGPSPFLSSIAGGPSPSNVSTDQIPIAVLFESTSGDINEFFLESDEEEQIGMSRVVADPDSDDEVIAEIIFRGKSISGDGVVFVDKLPDNDSESESDDDMENYIPPLPYGEFKDWEIVSCPPGNNYIHVYYQENRRRKYFTYLKELLPHVYREDLLLLRRRMNRWTGFVSSWKLYPKSSVHVLDLTNGKTVLNSSTSYCRDVVVLGNYHQTVQAGLRQAYECIASAPIPEQTATGKDMLNPLYGCDGLPKTVRLEAAVFDVCYLIDLLVHRVPAVSFDAAVLDVASTVSAACIVAAGYIVSAGI